MLLPDPDEIRRSASCTRADVPVARAGTASGTLGTAQQTALALGVALLGTLLLSLSGRPSVGMRDAFLVVIGLQIVASGVVAALTRLLPDPRPARACTVRA